MTSSTTQNSVAAYFTSYTAAQDAVTQLKQAGFTSADLGYAGRMPQGSQADMHEANTSLGNKTEGTWNKIKNFFEGGDVEPYADESHKGDVRSREIHDEDKGYESNDVHGSFAGMSIPESSSRYFGQKLNNSEEGAVVTVQAGSRAAEAEAILVQNGGDLGSANAEQDFAATGSEATAGTVAGETKRIQLLGEVLRVHKERISRGEVVIRKEVITENQTIQVPVTREELVVERIAGDGLTPASGTIGEDSVIRIPLSEERASVGKETVVREEVAIGKRAVNNVENVDSSVQHEELRVEQHGTNTTKDI